MAGTNNGNGEDKPMVDPQKQYLIEQFGNLMEKVGEGYGGPLQEELIRRMEQTIADFDEEVSEMLEHLRDNSVKRHEKLKEIWENPEQSTASSEAPLKFLRMQVIGKKDWKVLLMMVLLKRKPRKNLQRKKVCLGVAKSSAKFGGEYSLPNYFFTPTCIFSII